MSFYSTIRIDDNSAIVLPKASTFKNVGIHPTDMLRASHESGVNKQWPLIYAWPPSLRYIKRKFQGTTDTAHYLAVEKDLANLIIRWLDIHPINPSITLMHQFSTFRKAAQQRLDKILSNYHTIVPQVDGTKHRIPVFIETKPDIFNWNRKHPLYKNWRGMVNRGLDRSNAEYASVRVDPAFTGFRNDAANIHHFDKYAFFTYVRAIDFFIGHKPGYTATAPDLDAEVNTNACMHHYHIDRIRARYH